MKKPLVCPLPWFISTRGTGAFVCQQRVCRLGLTASLVFAIFVVCVGSASTQSNTTTRISVSSEGVQADGASGVSSLSADGRYVAFESGSTNLVAGDTNGLGGVFVHDRQTGTTTRVSVSSAGIEGNGPSGVPAISSDGRYVAFESDATNLVVGDTNGLGDVFVHDRQTSTTTRVSVSSAGIEGNGYSQTAAISSDGRYVTFSSESSNLVAADTNGDYDVFVHDRQTGATTRVSISSAGVEGNGASVVSTFSGDGRYVAFNSDATNLVTGDTNGMSDVFVHDLQTGMTTRVSVSLMGLEGNGGSYNPSLSSDGLFVAFSSDASNLVAGDTNGTWDVFVHDRQMGTTTRVSLSSTGMQGNGESGIGDHPTISADGRFIVFDSEASNLVGDDTNGVRDVFVHDRQMGTTTRVSLSSTGMQGNGYYPAMSADGRFVTFTSDANLVVDDTNSYPDVFVRDVVNTATGTSVVAEPVDSATLTTPVTVTFASVSNSGSTGLTTSSVGPTLPSGFSLGTPPVYYDLTTTAMFAGSVTVCIDYTTVSFGDEQALQLFHYEDGAWVTCTTSLDTVANIICGQVMSLSPFAIMEPSLKTYAATVQSPIEADGSSVFRANRGVIPLKFSLASNNIPTCNLPAATLSLLRASGGAPGPINEDIYITPADSGSDFRISNCQYIYNLSVASLGPGTYLAQIKIGNAIVGSASFGLK
ncbi:MAG: PD40 domain-containing protein [Acidobacteria bacterium]|nr:PD40 domain-containing protein [Acidobacteriota bacterium]